MPKYVVIGTYCEGAAEKRGAFRAEHMSRLGAFKEEGKIVTLGPTKDFTKLIAVLDVEDEAEARSIIEGDPYWAEGIWIDYELHEWIQAF